MIDRLVTRFIRYYLSLDKNTTYFITKTPYSGSGHYRIFITGE